MSEKRKYAYYPGCSLGASAVEYDASTRRVLDRLGVEVEEIPGWTCCGASAVEAVSDLLSYVLPARNLALAERDLPGLDVLVPCSACYLNLYRARFEVSVNRTLRDKVGQALDVEGLTFAAVAPVRHLLDVLANDIGADRVKEEVGRELAGLTVAPYYGCQALRPYNVFDDPVRPETMTPLVEAVGAKVLDWDMGAKCCGASLMVTHREAALAASGKILAAAQEGEGADVIVTVCPMCQLNLEAYQSQALKMAGGGRRVAILYLPQLLGLAMGMSEKELMLDKNLVVTGRFRTRLEWRPEEETPEQAEEQEPGEEIQTPETGG